MNENSTAPEKQKIEKSNQIVTYLKLLEEREIKEIVTKLGNNRPRNYDSIRTFHRKHH